MATSQIPDQLIFNGTTYYVHRFKLSEKMEEHFSEFIKNSWLFYGSSANWDGFVAKLIIRDNKLYIKELSINHFFSKFVYEKAIGKEIPDEGLLADCYSGELSSGFGECPGSPDYYSHHRYFAFMDGYLLKVYEKPSEFCEELKKKYNNNDSITK